LQNSDNKNLLLSGILVSDQYFTSLVLWAHLVLYEIAPNRPSPTAYNALFLTRYFLSKQEGTV
jgi:hypothetical protein